MLTIDVHVAKPGALSLTDLTLSYLSDLHLVIIIMIIIMIKNQNENITSSLLGLMNITNIITNNYC